MSAFSNFFGSSKGTESKADKTLVVKAARCPQNHTCPSVRVCQVGALTQKDVAAPDVNAEKCIKCGKCVRYCPMRALVLE